ncbi:hypothetical protein GGR21_002925 [Dysgonomonas hofstadii]|uniref:Uncharacterized protein n=1 Tax=Dysgonomonas hofstadii TaxID=637886 RepID=A0A840CPM4_9BACT|nr:hypothetical protein [Dysgonomonas hofstadii]MBB4037011.1 hypothetical protein [Dysgonomonas hofstadii]
MGALKIECFCNEKQMEKIVGMVAGHLTDCDRTDIADFDDMVDGVRVCAEFETYMDAVNVKTAEILDGDWDLLYEDSAVFTSRLRTVVDEYNRRQSDYRYQAHHVVQDRWED